VSRLKPYEKVDVKENIDMEKYRCEPERQQVLALNKVSTLLREKTSRYEPPGKDLLQRKYLY